MLIFEVSMSHICIRYISWNGYADIILQRFLKYMKNHEKILNILCQTYGHHINPRKIDCKREGS